VVVPSTLPEDGCSSAIAAEELTEDFLEDICRTAIILPVKTFTDSSSQIAVSTSSSNPCETEFRTDIEHVLWFRPTETRGALVDT